MINKAFLLGRVSEFGPKISWNDNGKPQTALTMIVERNGFRTFVPVLCIGAKAEHVAETIEPHDLICVEGEIGWKAGKEKGDGRLQVITFAVEKIAAGAASIESTN